MGLTMRILVMAGDPWLVTTVSDALYGPGA